MMIDTETNLRVWKTRLYTLQQNAPPPIPVISHDHFDNAPPQYHEEFHGPISRQETDKIMAGQSTGAYLIRCSQRAENAFTLVIKFDNSLKNYKLYYDSIKLQHYVGENRFDTVYDLVADGLIHLYIETRGADVLKWIASVNNYESSPYYQARYYTIQSRSHYLRKSSSRREGRVTYLQNSPTLRRQSIDNLLSGSHTNCGGPPPVPPHASPLHSRDLNTPSSKTDSNESIPSPNIVSRRPHNRDGSLSDISGKLEKLNLLDNNNQRISPRDRQGTPGTYRSAHSSGGSSTPEPSGPTSVSASVSLVERYNLPTQVEVSQLEKSHKFRMHTFRGPHWCDFCTHFMWGLVAQGVKCSDCGFQAHKKCSDRVPHDCLPDMKRLKRVFGVELTSLVKAENRSVPQVLVKCVTEIDQRNGFLVEGLYRVAGFHDHVEEIKMAFDKDCDNVDLSPSRCDDINILTSVVKSFLRQLPIPLITYDAYPDFMQAVKEGDAPHNRDKELSAFRNALCKLPQAHYQTLKYILGHLCKVAENQSTNMMTPENLAIVFAPTLLNSPDCDPMISLLNAQAERAIVEFLINNYCNLFSA